MKLSKTQEQVIKQAKDDIDFARTHNFYDWMRKTSSFYRNYTDEKIDEVLAERERTGWIGTKAYEMNAYNNEKNGIVLTMCNSRTLYKLQSLGLIEILEDANGEKWGVDHIKVLNY